VPGETPRPAPTSHFYPQKSKTGYTIKMCRNTPDALARPGFAPAQALNAHRIGLRQNIRRAEP